MKSNRVGLVFLLLLLAVALAPGAQEAAEAEPFRWEVRLEPEQVAAGQSSQLKIALRIAPEHYVYRDMTSFSVEAGQGVDAGEPVFPEAEQITDPFNGTLKEIYRGEKQFNIPLEVAADVEAGTQTIRLGIQYQGCSDTVCFLPKRITLSAALSVREDLDEAPAATEALKATSSFDRLKSASVTPGGDSAFERALAQGTFWAFLFVFIGGILTSFTPCVYPLIPITVSLFGARGSTRRLGALTLSATYVLGIATMYSILGLAAAATGAVFGQFLTNRWIASAVAVVFIAFGASMLGAFEIQLPAAWQQRLARTGGKGYAGAFTMGLLGGIIAAPCTGPALGAVLVFVAGTQNLWLGFWLLFTFALGLGMLFLVLGTFAGAVSRLPKSGSWMEGVKSVFAVVLFAFALYFLKDAFPVLKSLLADSAAHLVAALFLLAAGILLGGVHKTFRSPSARERAAKAAGVVLMSLGLWVALGFFSAAPTDLPSPEWIDSEEEGFRLARQEGKPVMMDFWADWCAACKELDRYTYSDPRVLKRLENFVSIKLDFSQPSEETQRLSEKYSLVGLPTVLFFDAEGRPLPEKRLVGFVDAEAFLRHIEGL